MEFAGVTTLQQAVDEVTRRVWAQRHPDQPDFSHPTPFGGGGELDAIREAARTAVFAAARAESAGHAAVPAPDAEWRERERLARIAALAYARTGF